MGSIDCLFYLLISLPCLLLAVAGSYCSVSFSVRFQTGALSCVQLEPGSAVMTLERYEATNEGKSQQALENNLVREAYAESARSNFVQMSKVESTPSEPQVIDFGAAEDPYASATAQDIKRGSGPGVKERPQDRVVRDIQRGDGPTQETPEKKRDDVDKEKSVESQGMRRS